MPFNFPLHKPGVIGLRNVKPDAFFLKLRFVKKRFKNPDFRAPAGVGCCIESPKLSTSKPSRLYRVARFVLLVAHQTMRVK